MFLQFILKVSFFVLESRALIIDWSFCFHYCVEHVKDIIQLGSLRIRSLSPDILLYVLMSIMS
jgi:hypothetical protein